MKLPNTGPSHDVGQLATTDRPGGAATSASLLSVLRQPRSTLALYAASSAFPRARGSTWGHTQAQAGAHGEAQTSEPRI